MGKDKNIWKVFNEMLEDVETIKKLTFLSGKKRKNMGK